MNDKHTEVLYAIAIAAATALILWGITHVLIANDWSVRSFMIGFVSVLMYRMARAIWVNER